MSHRICLSLALFSLVLLGPVAQAAAQPALSGSQFRIDPDAPSEYRDLAIAADPEGRLAVAWIEAWQEEPVSYDTVYTLRVRRFTAAGKPAGPAFRLAGGGAASFDDDVDIAAGRGGSCLVVWSAWGLQRSSLFARFLDASGRPTGKLLRLGTSTTSTWRPRVVADPTGGFIVAWREGEEDFYAQRVRTAGTPLGPVIRLSASPRYVTRELTALAVSRRGELVVAGAGWLAPDDAEEAFFQRFDARWRPRGGEVRVPSPAGRRSSPWNLALAFGADDVLTILWQAVAPASSESLLLARRFTAAGQWAGPAVRLYKGSSSLGAPALAADPGGGFLAVWSLWSAGSGFGRRIEPSGRLGPTFALDPEDLGVRGGVPQVVAQGKGSFAAVWHGTHGIRGQCFASGAPGRLQLRRRETVALEGSGTAQLEVLRREGSRGEVRVSYSVAGLTAVPGEDFDDTSGTVTFADGDSQPKPISIPVWDDDRPEADESFQVVLHDPEGGTSLGPATSADVEIRDDDTPSPLLAGVGPEILVAGVPLEHHRLCCPDVARAGSGFVAAWEYGIELRQNDFLSRVGFLLFEASGAKAGGGDPGDDDYGDEDFEPRIVPRPDGGFVLIWASDMFRPLGEVRRFAQRFDAAGEPAGPVFGLESFAWPENPMPLRAAPRPDGGFVAVGQRHRGTSFELFAERYDGNGRRLGTTIQVNDQPILDQSRDRPYRGRFSVATDAAGGFVVVWQRPPQPGLPGGIFARLFAASGAPRSGEIAVGGDVGLVEDPEVAAAPNGAFAVVWTSDRDGSGWGVSARWLDSRGAKLGSEVQVPSSSDGYQAAPKAAFGTGGELLVVWGARGQLYAAPGVRAGNEVAIAGSTRLAATETGWVVVWYTFNYSTEEREIRAQMLNR